jgi:hypothetical protein
LPIGAGMSQLPHALCENSSQESGVQTHTAVMYRTAPRERLEFSISLSEHAIPDESTWWSCTRCAVRIPRSLDAD